MKWKTTAKYGLPFLIGAALLLFISSAFFFYRGKETLVSLLAHGQNRHITTVYSRWWDLSKGSGLTWAEALEALHALEYDPVSHVPQKPGQFQQSSSSSLLIFLREFQYPEGRYPAQQVHLKFEHGRLDRIETATGTQGPAVWRLEPKLLAQWTTNTAMARTQIRLADLPSYVPKAVMAIEDKRFYRHGAFDGVGVLRALIVNLREGRLSQGASTISQQLARSIFLSPRRTLSRKLMEAVLAAYLELRFSKEQLLEMYLNQVYWGQEGSTSLIGIDAASRAYFGIPPRELTVEQMALLAGLLQSPNHYSPRNSPEIALERRNLVLRLMHSQGIISKAVYEKARGSPMHVLAANQRMNDAAYFLATLQDSLEEHYPGVILPTVGWSIYTTLDPILEHEAVIALQKLPHTKANVHPEAALVAIDPLSGGVRAWVGGTDYIRAPYDRAIRAHRQPGSAFKPFVMLAALDKHIATTATMLKDEPLKLQTAEGPWTPQNFDRRYRKNASLWDALVHSLNIPTVVLAMETGLSTVADYAHRAGIQSPISPYPAMALGASEVTLFELTNAYATLAAHGVYQPAYMVEDIVDEHGQRLEKHAPAPFPVFDPATIGLLTKILQAVLTEGTAAAAPALGFTYPAAGKTGTSENFQDAWFVGYMPQLACGVWVGYDQPKSLGRSAAGIALPLWVPFMQKALHLVGAEDFPEPKNLIWKTIDPENGLLVRSGCPTRKERPFLPGTEPTQLCSTHAGGLVGFFHRLFPGQKSPTKEPAH